MTPYYQDDAVTIYHGDCREILPTLPNRSVHLLATDPPYGVGYVSGKGRYSMLAGDADNEWVRAAIHSALQCLRVNRHFYVFGPDVVSSLTHGATCELIWNKGKHSMGDLSLAWSTSHERITFGVWSPYKSQAGSGSLLTRIRRGTVLDFPKQSNGRGAVQHPTEKPVMLLQHLIEASSLHGEVVLDPFAGSGSTLEAAVREGRKAIGIEIEERYCEIAAKRMAQEVLPL